jgi:hypothetical protein
MSACFSLMIFSGEPRSPKHPSAGAGFDLDLPGPVVATGFADQAAGRAAGRRAGIHITCLDQHMDVLSKNPAKPVDPAHSAGRNRRGRRHPFARCWRAGG